MTALITRFLPGLLPGLGAFLNPWVLIVIAIALGGAFAGGVTVEGWHRDSGDLASTEAWAKQYVADIDRYRGNADLTRAALVMQKKMADDAEAKWILEKSKNAKPLATCAPAAEAKPGEAPASNDPVVMLTPEFVGLYNGALEIGLREAGDPGGAHAGTRGPGSVNPDGVLDNVKDNAKLCNGFREVILQWQALARRNGWVKSP